MDVVLTNPDRANAPRFSVGAQVTHDNFYGTDVAGTMRLTIPLGGGGGAQRRRGGEVTQLFTGFNNRFLGLLSSRGPIIGSPIVTTSAANAITVDTTRAGNAVTDSGGNPLGSFYFADDANTAGAGSFDDPTTLSDAVSSSGAGGYVVALENGLAANITSAGQTLLDNQQLLGGGTAISLLVDGSPMNFTLPGAAGTIEGTGGAAAVNLAGGNTIQNVTLTGTGAGITGTGVAGAHFTTVTVRDTAGAGISLTNTTGSFAATGVRISNTGGAALDLQGGSESVTFDAASSITQGGAGAAVNAAGHTGTLSFAGTIDATSGTGLQFSNADGTYSFTGGVTLNGGDAGIDILNGSAGSFTFANATITSPSGTALRIDQSAATVDVQAGSSVTQASAARAVEITGNTGGTVTLTGPVNASGASTGILVDSNTGGTVTITDAKLGTSAARLGADALSVQNNTGGTVTVTALDTFTSGGSGIAASANTGSSVLSIVGGSVDAIGDVAVDLANTTLGNVTLASVTSAGSSGDGLSFDDVDGTSFTVTGATTVSNSASNGVEITGGSAATFSFGTVDVDTAGGAGVLLSGANGAVSITSLQVDGSTGAGLSVDGATNNVTIGGGSIGATTAPMGGGVVVQNQVSGTAGLTGVAVTGGAGAGVTLASNAGKVTLSGGSIAASGTSSALSVTGGTGSTTVGSTIASTGTGNAVSLSGTGGAVTLSGNVTNSGGGHLLSANGATAATTTISGALMGSSATGVSVSNIGAAASLSVTGATTLTTPSGDAITLASNAGAVSFGAVTITTPAGDGIELSGNTGAVTFGDVSIDMETTANARGVDYTGSNAATSFGTVTITNLGAGADQVGIDLAGATLSGTARFDSAAISGPSTSTSSVGIDLTGLSGNQIVNIGSQADPATGPSSAITDLHRGVLIDPTAAVQFSFGDGEGTADTGSSIDVNGQAGAYAVDAGSGTLAASSFNFTDVALGAGDTSNFPMNTVAPVFVSETGGTISAGAHGLSQDVSTISVTDVLSLTGSGQTFVLVAHDATGVIDVAAMGKMGFGLEAGQSLYGFNDGNVIRTAGSVQPMNITGNLGETSAAVTQNDATVGNSAATSFPDSVVLLLAADNNAIGHFDINGTLGGSIANGITVGGALGPLSVTNVAVQGGEAGIALLGLGANATFADVDVTGSEVGVYAAGNIAGTSITFDAQSSVMNTANTAIVLQQLEGDFTFNGTVTETDASGFGMYIEDGASGTVTFGGLLSLNTGTDDGIIIDNSAGATHNFNGGLDIDTTTGIGFGLFNAGIVNVNAPATGFNNVDSTAGEAINIDTVQTTTGMAFNRITSGTATTGSSEEGIEIDRLSGAGTFSAGSVTIQNAATEGIEIEEVSANISFVNTVATATEVTISGAGEEGIIVQRSTGTILFDAIVVDGSGLEGVVVEDQSGGSVTIDGGAIGAATTNAGGVRLTGNSVDMTIGADITQTSAASAVNAAFNSGGTSTFSGLVTGSTSTVAAVSLSTNSGATLTFSGGLDLDTTTGTGFAARTGGNINVLAPASGFNNVDASQGTALSVRNVSTSGGMAFNRVTSGGLFAGAAGSGIIIDTLSGAGTLSAGSVTVQNAGAYGAQIVNNSAAISFVNSSAAATELTVLNSGNSGVYLFGNSGTVTLDAVAVDGAAGRGLHFVDNTGTINVNGGTVGATTANTGAVRVSGGTATIGIDAALTQTGAQAGVVVTGITGGSVSFGGLVTADVTTNFNGISLVTNAGGTVTFSGGLNIDTELGTGFAASGGGDINVLASTAFNNVDASEGKAINLSGVSTTSGLAFNRLTSGGLTTGASGDGLVIGTLSGAGTFSAGSTTVRNSAARGIVLTNNSANLSFVNAASGTTSVTVDSALGTSIDLSGNTGAVTFGNTVVSNPTGLGIALSGTNSGAVSFGQTTVSLSVASSTALSLNGAVLSGGLSFGNFVVTGSAVTGLVGVDAQGATGSFAQLGDTDPSGASAAIDSNVATGVLFSGTTNLTFTFGDGESAVDQGSVNDASTPVSGTQLGTSNFDDVSGTTF